MFEKAFNSQSVNLSIILVVLLLDSGGILGLRNVGFLLMVFYCFRNFIKGCVSFDKYSIATISLVILISFAGVATSLLNNIRLDESTKFIYFLTFIVFSYFTFSNTNNKDFANAIIFTAGFVISLYLSLYLFLISNYIEADLILFFLRSNFEGFFYESNVFGINYYVIYFQSTLLICVFSLILFDLKFYKLYIITLIILLSATSRFGFFIAIAFPIASHYISNSKISKLITICFPYLLFLLFFFYVYIYFLHYSTWNLDPYWGLTSSEARIAHVISTFDSFEGLLTLIFGQGPGSYFFTIRSNDYVNNSELSQLEFLRKFGFFGLILFHIMLNIIFVRNHKYGNFNLNKYIFGLYLASMSNPILTSLMFSVFIGISLSRKKSTYKKNFKYSQ